MDPKQLLDPTAAPPEISSSDQLQLLQEKKSNLMDNNPARFQRTDQWLPVYSWLESLDRDEVVKSNEIKDWLAANAEVSEQLCSRHSHYHLMHYIKKCHVKILKRREKKKALEQPNQVTPVKVQPNSTPKPPAPIPSNPAKDLPKDSDAYLAKRNEALQKFEMLVEFENYLSSYLPKQGLLSS